MLIQISGSQSTATNRTVFSISHHDLHCSQ